MHFEFPDMRKLNAELEVQAELQILIYIQICNVLSVKLRNLSAQPPGVPHLL
jgi:hypothetical protein